MVSPLLDLQTPALHKVAMLRRAQISTLVSAVVAISVALVLASCAAFQRGAKPQSPPRPTPTPVVAAKAAVYYSSVEGLKVYSEPSTRSKVVGSLSLHEKVTRTGLERGYAHVEGAKGGLKGWVLNAQLIWRLPTAGTTGAPPAEEAQPEEAAAPAAEAPQAPAVPEAAPAAAEPVPEATPAVAVPARPKPTPGGVAPSIFNPY